MKRTMTLCEPQWIGDKSLLGSGYWSIKVICEYTPRFYEKLFGKKPYHTEHTYTNLNKYATSWGWRNQNGDELESIDIFGYAPGKMLYDHLDKHIAAEEMSKIQEKIIKNENKKEPSSTEESNWIPTSTNKEPNWY